MKIPVETLMEIYKSLGNYMDITHRVVGNPTYYEVPGEILAMLRGYIVCLVEMAKENNE